MQADVADDIRTIFNAPDRATADAYLAKAVTKYQQSASRLSEWMATNIRKGLRFFPFRALFGNCCARQMAWKDFTVKCVVELGW